MLMPARGFADDHGMQVELGAGSPFVRLGAGLDAINDAAAIVELSADGAPGRIAFVNAAFETLLGYDAAAAVGRPLDMLYGPLTEEYGIEFQREHARSLSSARVPIVYYRCDGVPMWVEVSQRRSDDAAAIVITLRDVSTRKEFEFALAREKRKLQVTLAAIGDGVITTVADGRIDYVNFAAREMLAIDAAEAYGEPVTAVLRLTDAAGAAVDVLDHPAAAGGPYRGQAQFTDRADVRYIAYVASPIGSEGFVIVLRDVTAQQHLSTRLRYEAAHDPLTRLANRRTFEHELDAAIESVAAGGGPHALAFLDLDRFKAINDNCGHLIGDRVLVDLAGRLQSQLRGRDVLARIGGDEFGVLLHDCALDNARRILEKLRAAVEAYQVEDGGRVYGLGVSIGMAAIDGTESRARTLLERADAACYAVKSSGRNGIAG